MFMNKKLNRETRNSSFLHSKSMEKTVQEYNGSMNPLFGRENSLRWCLELFFLVLPLFEIASLETFVSLWRLWEDVWDATSFLDKEEEEKLFRVCLSFVSQFPVPVVLCLQISFFSDMSFPFERTTCLLHSFWYTFACDVQKVHSLLSMLSTSLDEKLSRIRRKTLPLSRLCCQECRFFKSGLDVHSWYSCLVFDVSATHISLRCYEMTAHLPLFCWRRQTWGRGSRRWEVDQRDVSFLSEKQVTDSLGWRIDQRPQWLIPFCLFNHPWVLCASSKRET